jgi:hypothetical protein
MSQRETNRWHTVALPVGLTQESGSEMREVMLRKMTGNDEAIMAEPRNRNNGGRLITSLLASCAATTDGEPLSPALVRRLTSADRNFLLLELRRLTFGDEMASRYRCPLCQYTTTLVDDLGEIEVRRVDDDDGDAPEVTVRLVDGYHDPDGIDQEELVFGLPTGADEEAVSSSHDGNAARQRDALLARCLRRVGTLEPRRVNALGARVLSDLTLSDRRLIQRALDAAAPGPDLTRVIECVNCGETFRSTLDMTDFFAIA